MKNSPSFCAGFKLNSDAFWELSSSASISTVRWHRMPFTESAPMWMRSRWFRSASPKPSAFTLLRRYEHSVRRGLRRGLKSPCSRRRSFVRVCTPMLRNAITRSFGMNMSARRVGELESRIAQGYVKSHLDTMPTARECRKVLKIKDFSRFRCSAESLLLYA